MTRHQKQLNTKRPSYRQKLQFKDDVEKVKKGEKINPKKIFENSDRKNVKKKKRSKKKY